MSDFKSFILRRLLLLIPVFLGLYTIIFIITRILPGDPVLLMLGPGAGLLTAEQLALLRERLGLNAPVYVQYFSYLWGLFHGDWGYALRTKRPVIEDIIQFFPATFELTTTSMIIAIAIGIPVGVYSAVHRNKLIDNVSRFLSLGGVSIPEYWSGVMAQIMFAGILSLLPAAGRWPTTGIPPPNHITGLYVLDSVLTLNLDAFLVSLKHLILPAFILSLSSISQIARFVRGKMVDVSSEDFIITSKANGIPKNLVIYSYMLKNSLTTTLTMIGSVYALLLGGAFVVESVFAWPGIAHYTVAAVMYKDFNGVIGGTIIFGLGFLILNLAVDVLYGYLDPRVRYE